MRLAPASTRVSVQSSVSPAPCTTLVAGLSSPASRTAVHPGPGSPPLWCIDTTRPRSAATRKSATAVSGVDSCGPRTAMPMVSSGPVVSRSISLTGWVASGAEKGVPCRNTPRMPAAARRDELASRTRADLLAAAKRLFGERGYLDTKIIDIAAAAGRAVGSFYTHFDDKEQLLAVLRSELPEPAAPGPAGDDALRDHITACWTALRTHRPTAIALLQSATAAAPASGRLRGEPAGWTAPLRRHLENRPDRGAPAGDPELVAAAVGVMLAGLNQALPDGEPGDDRVAETVTNLVLHGLSGLEQ
ncbi:TetR/AcrR family transcriptional regulator [Amycolatopsis rifamycinica]|uniref:TetR/AcrR family transcriptional regulator n=1 Tax=Amycolatopsis rifamycinica TaxID=287986 RepID=UPI001F1C6CCB|nr:TetR/AcrR family transcriptional regulator [Amycolatopsis rifamycinica]